MRGAAGTLWIEALRIEPRDPAAAQPQVSAPCALERRRGSRGGRRARDRRATAPGAPAPGDAQPWLELDLGRTCEWGGVVVDFAASARACRLLASDDGERWTRAGARRRAAAAGGAGCAPADGEGAPGAARVRGRHRPAGRTRRHRAARARRVARALRHRHRAPRAARPLPAPSARRAGVLGAWSAPTATTRKGLLSEDGALEVDAESFTLEPFLWTDGRLLDVGRRRRRSAVARRRRICRFPASSWQAPDCACASPPSPPAPPGAAPWWRATRSRARGRGRARGAAVRRHPPVPGQPVLAEPQSRRRRRRRSRAWRATAPTVQRQRRRGASSRSHGPTRSARRRPSDGLTALTDGERPAAQPRSTIRSASPKRRSPST